MATQKPARPSPYPGLHDKPFWEFTAKHEFRLPRCAQCGKYQWPPAAVCAGCLSDEYTWERVSGVGTVLSWVVFQRQYFPGIPPPYNCILVQLDEGPLFISNLVGVEDGAIDFDLRVQVDFQDLPEGYTLPVFRLTDS